MQFLIRPTFAGSNLLVAQDAVAIGGLSKDDGVTALAPTVQRRNGRYELAILDATTHDLLEQLLVEVMMTNQLLRGIAIGETMRSEL